MINKKKAINISTNNIFYSFNKYNAKKHNMNIKINQKQVN